MNDQTEKRENAIRKPRGRISNGKEKNIEIGKKSFPSPTTQITEVAIERQRFLETDTRDN